MDVERVEGGCREDREAGLEGPLVSVIVVVFRDRAELESLIDNLATFRGKELEVVVIDGGSDDGSVELLRSRSDVVDYWKSERDSGLYDGMNKGVAAARGRFILHINAGDRLLKIPRELLEGSGPDVDVVCCRVAENGGKVWAPRSKWVMRFQNAWHHQGTLYRKEAHPGYDTRYRVFGDFDLNQRMVLAGRGVKFSNEVVASHELGGLSNYSGAYAEKLDIIRSNFGGFHANLVRCGYYAQHKYWTLKAKLKGTGA